MNPDSAIRIDAQDRRFADRIATTMQECGSRGTKSLRQNRHKRAWGHGSRPPTSLKSNHSAEILAKGKVGCRKPSLTTPHQRA